MKQVFCSIFFLLLSALEAHASPADDLYLKVQAAYEELLANPSEESEVNFFRSFPDNCHEFIIWKHQYDHSKERKVKRIELYIDRLGLLTAINDSVYCRKLVNLSIGASDEPDGFSRLQQILWEKVNDPKLFGIFIDLLSRPTGTRGEQLRFWMFYWSSLTFVEQGIVPKKKEEERRPELNLILKRLRHNKSMRKIVRLAYKYSAYQVYFADCYTLHGYEYEDYIKK